MAHRHNSYARYRQYRKNRRRYVCGASAIPCIVVLYIFFECFDMLGYLFFGVFAVLICYALFDSLKSKSNGIPEITESDNEVVIQEMSECKINEREEEVKMSARTTDVGYVNKNNQMNMGRTNEPGTDHMQWFYNMKCTICGHEYKANGSDIWQRKCPKCQGGRE